MTVGELRYLLSTYDADTHVAIVWRDRQRSSEGPWLAEIEKLLTATEIGTGAVDLFLEAIEVVFPIEDEEEDAATDGANSCSSDGVC